MCAYLTLVKILSFFKFLLQQIPTKMALIFYTNNSKHKRGKGKEGGGGREGRKREWKRERGEEEEGGKGWG